MTFALHILDKIAKEVRGEKTVKILHFKFVAIIRVTIKSQQNFTAIPSTHLHVVTFLLHDSCM